MLEVRFSARYLFPPPRFSQEMILLTMHLLSGLPIDGVEDPVFAGPPQTSFSIALK